MNMTADKNTRPLKLARFRGKRFPKWEDRLNAYLTTNAVKEFEWGTHDCCTFAGGAVEAMTGENPMEPFIGLYNNQSTAEELISRYCNGQLYKGLIKVLGSPIPGVKAQRGDVGFFNGCCGVIIGSYGLFLIDGQLGMIPIRQIRRAFRIG